MPKALSFVPTKYLKYRDVKILKEIALLVCKDAKIFYLAHALHSLAT